jgi:peptidoglycan/LPS O-acetylase OafA/YrhL
MPGAHSVATDRILALDGLRGIAILLVMILHFTIYGGSVPPGNDRIAYRLAQTGWIGVDLFFVLSGFLITGILMDTRARSDYLRSFFIRRVLRIFPLYYASLLVLLVLLPVLMPMAEFNAEVSASAWYWTYLVNVRTAIEGWPAFGYLGHFWTLAVEEQFYLVWPFLVLALQPVALKRLCLFLFAGALILRVVLHLNGEATAAYVLMPARVDTLGAGAIIAVLVRERGGLQRAAGWAKPACVASAAALGAYFVVSRAFASEGFLMGTIGYSVIALLFASILALVLAAELRGRPFRVLQARPLVTFGKYSYAMYVIHHPVMFFLPSWGSIDALAPWLGGWLPAQLVFVAVMSVVTLTAAVISWYVLETRFLRLKDALAPRPRRVEP